jgi:Na+/H+ antiporter NhaA
MTISSPPHQPDTTPRRPRALEAFREYVATENASAVAMVVATVTALVWANSPWSGAYDRLWTTDLSLQLGQAELAMDLRHWVNEGLMAFFFFVAGLEIRREFDMGELRERRRLAAPVFAALGGMVVPAVLYLAFNAGQASARGWGIVMGTDTAFALGVLTLIGAATPRVRTFLLTLVVVDDAVALTVIAVAYTDDLAVGPLVVAGGLLAAVAGLRRLGAGHGVPYFILGLGVWLATLMAGIHATIAGVALGLLATAYPPSSDDLARAGTMWRLFREEPTPGFARSASRSMTMAISPNERLQHLFHPWSSYVIVPLFALANAGVQFNSEVIGRAVGSTITIAVVVGLVVGKLVGVAGVSWLISRPRFGIPLAVTLPEATIVASVAGIGFTVSLLIADISFTGADLEEAKVGVLAASIIASLLAWLVYRLIGRLTGRGSISARPAAPPLSDLSDPIDLEVDHIRGEPDAPLTMVEYGDYECPHCGRAETVVRRLLDEFGHELTYVFRHLPLDHVHPQARQAAEAAEAAGAQGRFWEMHDQLFAHSPALSYEDLLGYAADIGLDVDRFAHDLTQRREALRVQRDVVSADNSGASGTPTFFINGRRHVGALDVDSLAEALRRSRLAARSD